jgi:hypothetical protein
MLQDYSDYYYLLDTVDRNLDNQKIPDQRRMRHRRLPESLKLYKQLKEKKKGLEISLKL